MARVYGLRARDTAMSCTATEICSPCQTCPVYFITRDWTGTILIYQGEGLDPVALLGSPSRGSSELFREFYFCTL